MLDVAFAMKKTCFADSFIERRNAQAIKISLATAVSPIADIMCAKLRTIKLLLLSRLSEAYSIVQI